MKKIVFAITSLTLGGAERVLVDLANKLCKEFDITIVTIYGKGELEKQLSKEVKIKSLYPFSYAEMSSLKRRLIPLKISLCKKGIYNKMIGQGYSAEIAFLEGPITRVLSSVKSNAKKIAWIHNDISRVFGNGIKANIKKKLAKKEYKKYDSLVFVSNDNLEKFKQTYQDEKWDTLDMQVIYNYIDANTIKENSEIQEDLPYDENSVNFLTVARLTKQKAIDRLIKIHTRLQKENLKHHIYIIGDGPERSNLEKMIQENKVEKTFHLLGKKENPYPYMKNADYICLLSNYEGYGMVLEEAKILNKPILITDTAAREAVKDYEKAIIFENNENEIYEGLKDVLEKEKQIQENIEENYDNSPILEQVKKLVGE